MRVARPVVLSAEQRDMLESRAGARCAAARSVERARIALLAASGMQDKESAAQEWGHSCLFRASENRDLLYF
jgi:hypothetical protein